MSNLIIDMEDLPNILKIDCSLISILILDQIIDNLGESEHSLYKCLYLGIFKKILTNLGSISEIDANVFLGLIESKNFRKTYISMIKKFEYNPINSQITNSDNPLFHIGKLKVNLNNLIIKARIQYSLNNGKNIIFYKGNDYIDIRGDIYKVLETYGDFSILKNENGFFLSQNVVFEIILNRKEHIEFIKVFGKSGLILFKDFEDFKDTYITGIYNCETKKILLLEEEINLKEILGEVFAIFRNEDGYGIYSIRKNKILLAGKKNIPNIQEIGKKIFIYFVDDNGVEAYYDIENEFDEKISQFLEIMNDIEFIISKKIKYY